MSRKPWVCQKCGHTATSEVGLERHLEEANHLLDLDYPLYAARVRLEAARDASIAAKRAHAAAIAEYSRLKVDWRVAKREATS